jgi:FdhE protein
MNSPPGSSPLRTTRVLDPEQIAMQAGRQMPFLRLPVRSLVFFDRQLRLRQLAASHPMREYLVFIADLAQAQHQVLQDYAAVTLPGHDALEAAAKVLKPPMPAFGWTRDAVWLAELRRLLGLFRGACPKARRATRSIAWWPPTTHGSSSRPTGSRAASCSASTWLPRR